MKPIKELSAIGTNRYELSNALLRALTFAKTLLSVQILLVPIVLSFVQTFTRS